MNKDLVSEYRISKKLIAEKLTREFENKLSEYFNSCWKAKIYFVLGVASLLQLIVLFTPENIDRVSDIDQSEERQIVGLKPHGIEKWFIEKVTGKLMLKMIAAIYEFERTNMLERQREGIAIAKSKGKYKGRKKIEFPSNWQEVYTKWKSRELKGTEAMKELTLKKNTFYSLVKEYETSQQNDTLAGITPNKML